MALTFPRLHPHVVNRDDRALMHRARPFDDAQYRGELRRVTTLDIAEPALVASRA